MELKITEWMAIYATIVSTLTFCWNIKQSKPKIKVNILPGSDIIDGVLVSGYFIVVRNISAQAVPIGSIELLLQYEHIGVFRHIQHMLKYKQLSTSIGWVHHSLSIHKIDTKCPIKLEPRSSHIVIVDYDTVKNILEGNSYRVIKANVQDQLWNDYTSKAINVPEHP